MRVKTTRREANKLLGGFAAIAATYGMSAAYGQAPKKPEFVEFNLPPVPFKYDGNPISLRLSYYAPTTHKAIRGTITNWLKSIEKETAGKIKFKTYFGGSLHSAKDGFKALATDITDLTAAYAAYSPRTFNMMHVADLPFLFDRNVVASRVLTELYPKYFKSEYEKTGAVLSQFHSVGPNNIHSIKPITNLQELRERKLRSAGGESTKILAALGASPVSMPTPEMYTSLQRGVIEGAFLYNEGVKNYRLDEIVKYSLQSKINIVGLTWGWNPKTWRSMPDLVREYLVVKQSQFGVMLSWQADYDEDLAAEDFRRAGIKVLELDRDEKELWRQKTESIIDDFVREQEKAGRPGAQLLDDVRELIEKYNGMSDHDILVEATRNPINVT